MCALALAVLCALRLARFNANIDVSEQPHKSAGFLTGVPAPAGAALAMLPMYLWFWTGAPIFRSAYIVAPWVAFVAALMVSSIATFSWRSEEHTSELQSLMRISYAVFCLKKKTKQTSAKYTLYSSTPQHHQPTPQTHIFTP